MRRKVRRENLKERERKPLPKKDESFFMPLLMQGSAARRAQQRHDAPAARARAEQARPGSWRSGAYAAPETPASGGGREALRLPHPPRFQSTGSTQAEHLGRARMSDRESQKVCEEAQRPKGPGYPASRRPRATRAGNCLPVAAKAAAGQTGCLRCGCGNP